MNELTTQFLQSIDGAKWVKYDEETLLIFVWRGGHTVNIFSTFGECVDMYMTGGFQNDDVTLDRIQDSIEEYLERYYDEEED
jgi:hypothetical protein